jgi:hypothetical protein
MYIGHGLGPFIGMQGAENEHHDHNVGALELDAFRQRVGGEIPDIRLDRAARRGFVELVFLWHSRYLRW